VSELLTRAEEQLEPVEGTAFLTYASRGQGARASEIAERAGRAWDWMAAITPPVHARPPLFVLSPADWSGFALMPVYGMPQAWSDRLVVGVTSEGLWSDYLGGLAPLLDADGGQRLRDAYGAPPDLGGLFADLLVAHEVGHYFHGFSDDGATDLARPWVAELFANVALYGYLAECEPEHLHHLEVVCEVSAAVATSPWSTGGLAHMGGGTANGYVWFQLLLILVARRLWAAAGATGLTWFRTAVSDAVHDDEAILSAFSALDPGVGAALRDWPHVQAQAGGGP
jgi:hypothetical protein